MLSRRTFLQAGVVTGLALAGSTASSAAAGSSTLSGRRLYFPPAGNKWETVAPADVDWQAGPLRAALDLAGEQHSSAVVILHRGRIMAERYWSGAGVTTVREVASVQKSVTALLAGAATETGALDPARRVSRWLGRGWSAAPRAAEDAITVRHLLTMTSGLDDSLRFEAPAGRRWYYNNTAYHRTHDLLEKATGTTLPAWCRRTLFDPLGITASRWHMRRDIEPEGYGLRMTARELARVGLLVLADGRWAGRRVLPGARVVEATRPSQRLNRSYGLLWWLNGQPSYLTPGDDPKPQPGPVIPQAPADLVAGLGRDDQKLYVVPSLDLVVVRQGARSDSRGEGVFGFDRAFWKELAAAAPTRSGRPG